MGEIQSRTIQPGNRKKAVDQAIEWLFPALTLLLHLIRITGYGIFRDELYYVACGEHLDWGYVDHPPLIGAMAALLKITIGTSLPALRLLPALAGAATVWITIRIARDLGGGPFAAALAGVAALFCPLYISLFGLFTMNAFDILFWAVLWWIFVWLLNGRDRRLWLLFGLVAGIGLMNKISVLFLAFGLGVGIVVTRRWSLFLNRWFVVGSFLAALLFLPHVIWQIAHGWPTLEFMENARRYKMSVLSPAGFFRDTSLMLGPLAVPAVLVGLFGLFFSRPMRAVTPLGPAVLAVLALMIATHGKPYYMGPVFVILFAAGGVGFERITAQPRLMAVRLLYLAGLAAGSLLLVPLSKPILPEETYIRYAARLGVSVSSGERHDMGPLPQHFADMHGWRELAETVAGVYRKLSPGEQARACVAGQNYGEAGAIDYFGKELGLPRAFSGHNSYHLWGPGACTGEVVIVIGDDRETLEELFENVEQAATFHSRYVMPYENDLPIWVARGLKQPIQELWPALRDFI